MKNLLRIALFAALILGGWSAQAQKAKVTQYHIEVVKAKVIGILEDNNRLAVLQIEQADTSSRYELQPKDEILVQFFYTTAPTKGEPKLAGVKSADRIMARLAGNYNPNTQQYDYLVFEYDVIPPDTVEVKKE